MRRQNGDVLRRQNDEVLRWRKLLEGNSQKFYHAHFAATQNRKNGTGKCSGPIHAYVYMCPRNGEETCVH